MKIEKIKSIPKYILAKIEKLDKSRNIKPCGQLHFYSYLTKNDGELCKVTCAVKIYKNKWYCKQVAVHGLRSDKCFCKDIEYSYMGGYKVGFYYEGMRQYSSPRWFEDGKWYNTCDDKYFNPSYAPLVNLEYVYKFPEFKYSACELYKGDDILAYLRTYEKYPIAEMLVKLGLSSLALSKQILEKATKDKSFRKYLGKNRDTISFHNYYVSAILNAYKQNKSLAEVQAFESFKKELNNSYLKSVREIAKVDYDRFYKYLNKQGANITLYSDYVSACNYLGIDMSKDKNRYPHDFMHAHDVTIDDMRTARELKIAQERREREEEQKTLQRIS